mgnify:CR=1 FL=1
MTLIRCQVYLAGQRPSNWEHHLYHCKLDGDLSHSFDRHTHIDTDIFTAWQLLGNIDAKV